MTPPSAEAVTPTTEEPKPVIPEPVDTETSLTVKTKAQPDDRPTSITIGDGPLLPDKPMTNVAPVATNLEKPITELEQPVTTEAQQPVTTDTEKPVPTETDKPVTTETEKPVTAETDKPVTTETDKPVTTETAKPVNTGTEKPVTSDEVKPVPTEDRLAGEPVAPVTEGGKAEESTDKISLPTGEEVERFVKAAPPDVNPNPHS